MKILIVGNNKPGHFAPFVEEQARALQMHGCEVFFSEYKAKHLGLSAQICWIIVYWLVKTKNL